MKNRNKKVVWGIYIWYFILLIADILFLLFFSSSTSPLSSNYYGWDSAFYQMAGRSMVKGRVMYRDIFEMKGPYFFLIQYLGQLLWYGRYGVFIIQIFCLYISLYFMDRSLQVVCGNRRLIFRVISVCTFFFLLGLTLEDGNLTEEYSLPVLFICLYLYFKFMENKRNKTFQYSLVIGIAFGYLVFIRITNAGLICILIVSVLIELILQKQINSIYKCIAGFVTGFLIISFPICAYYGYKHALFEMFYTTFAFSFLYSVHTMPVVKSGLLLVLVIIAVVSLMLNRNERVFVMFSVLSVLGTTGILLLGYGFVHYYQLIIPPVLGNLWLILRKYNKVILHRQLYLGMICFMVIINGRQAVWNVVKEIHILSTNSSSYETSVLGRISHAIVRGDPYSTEAERVLDVLKQLPEESYNDVYDYNTELYWLCIADILPYNKYCCMQELFINIDPQIEDEIDEMFDNNPPRYVVLGFFNEVHNKKILDRLEKQYYVKYCNDSYVLYEAVKN